MFHTEDDAFANRGRTDKMLNKLKTHVETAHEESLYVCDQCEYKAIRIDKLKTHVETAHEESIYDCDQCEYKAIRIDKMKTHVETAHE